MTNLPGSFSFPLSVQEELLALARSCRRGRGSFVLTFARCSVISLRERMVEALRDALAPAGVTIHEVELTAETPDLPAALAAAPGNGDPLFVYGLAQAMPSAAPGRVLAQLNERRGQYQKLGRPLVLWLPEYALRLVARNAPDFWAWRSGVYEFTLPESEREALLEREVHGIDWPTQWNLDQAAARARLHLLRGLLDEYTGEEEETRRARAETLRKLADLETTLVGYEAAEPRLREALRVYESLGDRRGMAVTQHSLAYLYWLRGDYEEAERLYRASLETKEQLGDRRGVAVTQGQLAYLYLLRGDYEEAERLYRASLETKEQLGDRREVAVTQHALADLYRLRGDYEEAERFYRASLETMKQLGDRRGVAVTLHNLALLRRDQGRPEEALELLSRSRDINIALGLDKDVATVEETIAKVRDEISEE